MAEVRWGIQKRKNSVLLGTDRGFERDVDLEHSSKHGHSVMTNSTVGPINHASKNRTISGLVSRFR